ncbi:NAD(P)/FAD-dependent oxidoreductase [Paraburkholderia hospita]|uniref:NAD(P)/FAD-dependent oxidoreductase n=1 Tax=Paraburkholderia hospita TaxID=169430 RepID=UPI0009A8F99A|nr:NAD(P)/FAD-dependent oxidoreductase [Paraburkholderia hospita]SKD04288.1 NADH dehydrogenase, FAD-containing subunit [Paraburkholderia hospita]
MEQNTKQRSNDAPHRIVIVGGGAGGLELATRLGNTVGRKRRAEVLLVDRYPTHFWKPLLHEAASGHIDPAQHDISYAVQAKRHSFRFVQGDFKALDSNERRITVASMVDEENREIVPAQQIPYDTLVLAVGSVTNFFNVAGAEEEALRLENVEQAEQFRRKLLAACFRAGHEKNRTGGSEEPLVNVNIIGGGATGVELAASVRDAVEHFADYRFAALDPTKDICVRVIEGNDRVLPGLSPELSAAALSHLLRLNVQIMTKARVIEVRKDALLTAAGDVLPSDLTLWAAGVAGAPSLSHCPGLRLNRNGQMLINTTLQSVADPRIYAIGDCASIDPNLGTGWPITAQAAHQQAVYLASALAANLTLKSISEFRYRDGGTLVSFGSAGAVGRVASQMPPITISVKGSLARILYALIYRRHLVFVTGTLRASAATVSQWIKGRLSPPVRLH